LESESSTTLKGLCLEILIAVGIVADQGCFIPDPDFCPSRIPDAGSRISYTKTATKERGEKNLLSYLFCSHKNYKNENYFDFELVKKKKKIWDNLQRILELSTQKLSLSFQNMGSGSGTRDPRSGIPDPGSGIRKKPIPDPGLRGQKGTGSRIRIRKTGCWSGALAVSSNM
jgi:hypothetical protein